MTTTPSQRHLATAIAVALYGVGTTAALAQSAPSKPPQQVVKPPIALAYIDVATASSDMPGGNMMGAAAQGGSSGGLFGALGGLARGAAAAASGGGNTFGQTRSIGFSSGRYVDVSVYTTKNRSLADATQMIPAVMNLGESLKLVAPIPEKPVPVGPVDEKPYEQSYEKPKGKMSIYWGCGETIRPGQPRKDDRQLPDSASLVGQHSFFGTGLPDSFKVSLGAPQDLMPPIQLSQRRNETGFDLEWQSIPHTRGYFIAVMGGKSDENDSGEAIFWTSSELPDVGFGLLDYQSNTNIDKWIGEKVVLPPAAVRCAVPKGIFPDGSGGMLRMIAYGSEAYFAFPPRPTDPKIAWEPEWQTKVRVKSTFFSVLGGTGESEGRLRGTREEPAKAKEEKKPNPVELLKGLFGR